MISNFAYLVFLLVSFSAMMLIDYRYHLAFFHDSRRTALTILIGVAVFSAWDAAGIALNIFFSGQSPYMIGFYLAPEYPIEELFFLAFLCYVTLILYRLGETKWLRTSS